MPKKRKPTVFVSYSTKDKRIGAGVKQVLRRLHIRCFLAHADLEVSDEWKECILKELRSCDVFIALLSAAFRDSEWAPQEVGIIVGRADVPIIPLSVDGTIPFGFISHIQSRPLRGGEVTESLLLRAMTKKAPRIVIPGLIKRVAETSGFRLAEAAMKPLVPLFKNLTKEELDSLVRGAIKNGQVWSAADCRNTYLPKLIRTNRKRIEPDDLRVLKYQIEHDRWYPRRDPDED